MIRKLSFLQIANKFLLKDKEEEGESFSSAVITELVFPKFDLCHSLQQLNQQSSISMLVFQRVIKKLYKFFLNLLANTKEAGLREKAIKDLSKSISQLFSSDLLFEKGNLLEYVAHKISKNYYQLDFEEQITFLIEILQVITS